MTNNNNFLGSRGFVQENKIVFISILMLLVIFVVLVVLQKSKKNNKSYVGLSMPTSYDNKKNGNMALFILLNKMGYNTRRYKGDFQKIKGREKSSLIMISPFGAYLSMKKAEKIYNWVLKGNQLVIIDEGPNPFWDLLAVNEEKILGSSKDLSVIENSFVTKNVKSIGPVGPWRFKLPPRASHPFSILLKDKNGIICASTRVGQGKIIIMSAPQIFSNININRKDNVIFITNLFSLLKDKNLSFDESIHGYNPYDFNFSPVTKIVFYQLGIVILLFYLYFLIRFGKARGLTNKSLRASTEYIYSLAGLFYKASCRDFAAYNLFRNFARRVGISFVKISHIEKERLIGEFKNNKEQISKNFIKVIEENWRKYKDNKFTAKGLLKFSQSLEIAIQKNKSNKIIGKGKMYDSSSKYKKNI